MHSSTIECLQINVVKGRRPLLHHCTSFLQLPRSKSVTSWRGQQAVVSVVSFRISNSITTTCRQLVALDVAMNNLSWGGAASLLPPGSLGERCKFHQHFGRRGQKRVYTVLWRRMPCQSCIFLGGGYRPLCPLATPMHVADLLATRRTMLTCQDSSPFCQQVRNKLATFSSSGKLRRNVSNGFWALADNEFITVYIVAGLSWACTTPRFTTLSLCMQKGSLWSFCMLSCESHSFAVSEAFSSSQLVTSWTHRKHLLTAE